MLKPLSIAPSSDHRDWTSWLFDGASLPTGAGFKDWTFGADSSFVRAQFRDGATFQDARFAGEAPFEAATFGEGVTFTQSVFMCGANFSYATFGPSAGFVGSQFEATTSFRDADFDDGADFDQATFWSQVSFSHATFSDRASLTGVEAKDAAYFTNARFGSDCRITGTVGGESNFRSATFGPRALFRLEIDELISFENAEFGERAWLDHISAGGPVSFKNARFGQAPRMTLLGPQIDMSGLELAEGALVEVGWAELELSRLVLDGSTVVSALAQAPRSRPSGLPEQRTARPRILTVQGTDLANLVLCNADLRPCNFAGSYNIDKLRLDGAETFGGTPGLPLWTRRRVLTDERMWRRQYSGAIRSRGWFPAQYLPQDHEEPQRANEPRRGRAVEARSRARQVAQLYRALRKSKEDSKDEPGAADFYYGEMEMRRLGTRSPIERALLTAYWLVAGYGLRASRALAAFVIALVLGAIVFNESGFDRSPQLAIGIVRVLPTTGEVVYGRVQQPGARLGFGAAVEYSIRSSTSLLQPTQPRPMTYAGKGAEAVLRLLGPLLLGLTILSLRNRVKR